jgi:hypothetical protein
VDRQGCRSTEVDIGVYRYGVCVALMTHLSCYRTTWISRAILVSNEPPILDESTEKEDIRFAVYPPNEQGSVPVTALQLSSEGMTCPRHKCRILESIEYYLAIAG